jgi:hypothetical protein
MTVGLFCGVVLGSVVGCVLGMVLVGWFTFGGRE